METGVGGDDMGTEEEGSGREAARCVSEAFRCQGANLLPDTKFIGNGLFIKYLGQVDLPGAPLRHRSQVSPSLGPLPLTSCSSLATVFLGVVEMDKKNKREM